MAHFHYIWIIDIDVLVSARAPRNSRGCVSIVLYLKIGIVMYLQYAYYYSILLINKRIL